jgi:[NiFe] hydrogenase diaphorase moiety large subunit
MPLSGAELVAWIATVVRDVGGDRTRLLDIALAVQRRCGYVSYEAMAATATALGLQPVEVQDVVSFYAFLNQSPKGRFQIRLSKTPVSLMKGAAAVARAFAAATGAPLGETSSDGLFSLEWTSDIGMGDQEPAALINGTVLTALAPDDVPAIVAALRTIRSEAATPLFPGRDVPLSRATLTPSLVRGGPVLFGDHGRAGDGLRAALRQSPDEVIQEVSKAGLRGRGGAGFPTAMKWKFCRQSVSDAHYVVCNADEGEPGTFKDRVLLTELPDLIFDGMTIAGYAIGATHGLLYLRGEYAYLFEPLQQVLAARRAAGLLGSDIGGHAGCAFDIRVQLGAGAYICGEESALLDSADGKRGAPRDRPPFPTDRGYREKPTAVDNVETFACAARILEHGAAWFAGYGTRESTGTKLLSVSGDCARPGVYEVAFGLTIHGMLDLVGASDASFVQVSGPSGESLSPKDFGRAIAFEDLATGGSMMVFGADRDVLDVALQFTDFFVDESCGWCAPCRIGTTLLRRQLETILANRGTLSDVRAIVALANTVTRTSRCGLGQTAANPILTTIRNFPELYEARLQPQDFVPRVTLREALAEAVVVQGREPVAEAATA